MGGTGLRRVAPAIGIAVWIAGVAVADFAQAATPAVAPTPARAGASLKGPGIAWTPNAGQWNAGATYRARMSGGSIWMGRDGRIMYQFDGQSGAAPSPRGAITPRTIADRIAADQPAAATPGWVLAERFAGAGRVDRIEGVQPQRTHASWSVGESEPGARAPLPTYAMLDLGEVYPGIDVRLRATGSNVEKLFTVRPGRDPAAIRLAFDGARGLRVTGDGALEAMTGNGPVRYTAPVAFQTVGGRQVDVPVRYALDPATGEYGFALDAWDRSLPLTIDPLLQSTYLSGSSSEAVYGIAVHPQNGDVYVTGSTRSIDFPQATGAQTQLNGTSTRDAFIARLNPALTQIVQATYFGGSGYDDGIGIVIHPATGDVYISGMSDSADLPARTGAAQPSRGAANKCGFIARLDAALATIYRTTYVCGSGSFDTIAAIAVHPYTGEIYVAGSVGSTDLPHATGGAQATYKGNGDGMVARFDRTLGTWYQSTYYGTSAIDRVDVMAIHPLTGDVYIAGYAEGAGTTLPAAAGGAQPVNAGLDTFVARLNAPLTQVIQTTYLGGTGSEDVSAIAINPQTGDVYVAGSTDSAIFPGLANATQTAVAGSSDAYVARFAPTLKVLYQSALIGGSSSSESGRAIAINPQNGDVLLAGSTAPNFTTTANLPATTGGIQPSFGGSQDIFVARFDFTLQIRAQATYLGGTGHDDAYAIAFHPTSGEIYVAGRTSSTSFPGIAGGADQTLGPGDAGVIVRLSPDLMAVDVQPDAFTFPGQINVPVSTTRTAGPVHVTGIAQPAILTLLGALSGEFCISTAAGCTCDANSGGTWTTGLWVVANNQYLCVRHVSGPVPGLLTESIITVGGYATKFQSFTGTGLGGGCALDIDGNGTIDALTDGLMLLRAMFGLTGTSVTNSAVGAGASRSSWAQIQGYLNGNCGTAF